MFLLVPAPVLLAAAASVPDLAGELQRKIDAAVAAKVPCEALAVA